MTEAELQEWAEDFEAFHARFAPIFGRKEPREQAQKYIRGLLAPVERKNGWQLAEAVGEAIPDSTQRLLYLSRWEADEARDELERYVSEVFGEEEGIGVVDETGFIKKGQHSVGVKRQYSGTAGKIENCQVATFLSYVSGRGQVLLDRRLYLPEEWAEDRERRARAKVPKEVVFQTKPQQAGEMLKHAWELDVPIQWVTGDEVYGDAPDLRATISAAGRWYVLGYVADTDNHRIQKFDGDTLVYSFETAPAGMTSTPGQRAHRGIHSASRRRPSRMEKAASQVFIKLKELAACERNISSRRPYLFYQSHSI